VLFQKQEYNGKAISGKRGKGLTGNCIAQWSNAGKNVLLHVTLTGMNALKIFAADVGNLSDARYFAALGADFLSFDLSPFSEEKWQKAMAMAEWIDGPKLVIPLSLTEKMNHVGNYALLFDTPDQKAPFPNTDVFFTITLDSLSDNLPANSFTNGSLIVSGNVEDLEQKGAALKNICLRMPVYLDLSTRTENLTDLIIDLKPEGVVVRGGQEEKPGFKSFDELDTLFDQLAALR
jgi:phosphoribosylanthranilate isomerase